MKAAPIDPRPMSLRIAIAEDSVILREGLIELLQSRGVHVVAAVGNTASLEEALNEHQVDVAIIDVRLPPTHTDEGIRYAIRLRHTRPEIGILIFSHHLEADLAAELLAAGASRIGYLLKERVSAVDDFIDALARIASGGTALDPELVTALLAGNRRRSSLATLTPREHEVLALMAQGLSNRAIAQALVVGDRAIEKHISSLFTKLDLSPDDTQNRRVQAVLTFFNQPGF